MKVRLIGIGDLHLAPGPRNTDRLAALKFVIDDAMATIADALTDAHISAWLVCGDLNDAKMSIDDRNALIEYFEIMAAVAPVVVVKGNHDFDGDLDFLAHLDTKYPIEVATTSQVIQITLADNKTPAAIFCLPYPSKANIVAAGFAHEDIARVFQESMDVVFMEAATHFQFARENGCLTGMVGHLTIGGAIASTGQPQIGGDMELTPGHLRRLGDCFQLFGHIHKHQRVDSAIYAGSLCRLDWGETEPKGYVVIECEQHDDVWTHAETFVPIPVPPMYHVEGVLTRENFLWRCTKGPGGILDTPPESWTDCDVRVRYTYASAERDVLDDAVARMERQFESARRADFEPIASTDRMVRAPEVVQATTFEDKIKAWAKLMGVSWSDQIAVKAQYLESMDDDLLVTATRAQLDDVMARGAGMKPNSRTEMPPPVPGGDVPALAQTNYSIANLKDAGSVLHVERQDGTTQQFDVTPIKPDGLLF